MTTANDRTEQVGELETRLAKTKEELLEGEKNVQQLEHKLADLVGRRKYFIEISMVNSI